MLNQKAFAILPIVLIVGLIMIIAGGAYYLGKTSSQPSNQITLPQTQIQPSAAVSPSLNPSPNLSINLQTKTFQLKKQSAVNGSETINVSVLVPSDWTFQVVEHSSNFNQQKANCEDYMAMNSSTSARLVISPICNGWSAKYTKWPQDGVIIKEEQNVGNDGHTAYTVRYYDSQGSVYRYTEGEKTTSQIQDTVLISFGEDNFIPANIYFSFSEPTADKESILKVADQMVASIKAQ